MNEKVELSEPHDVKPSLESITEDKRAEVVETYGEPVANEVTTEKYAGADIEVNNRRERRCQGKRGVRR